MSDLEADANFQDGQAGARLQAIGVHVRVIVKLGSVDEMLFCLGVEVLVEVVTS